MAPKILFLRKFSQSDTDYLKEHLSEWCNLIIPNDYSDSNLIRLAKNADVFLGHNIFKELLDSTKNLKLIQVTGAGIDGLDLEILKGRNISVCNSKSNTQYVAEHAISLLLSIVKKISIHDRNMREGKWFRPKNNNSDTPYLSDTLLGKTIGFLGFGNIAQNITLFLSGFKVKFIAFVKNVNKKRFLLPGVPCVNFLNLCEVLSKSDSIFVTLPLTQHTRNLISSNEFKLMKKTLYLVNISRGPIVNEEHFYNALKEERIAGAAIDTWYDDIYMNGDKKYPSKRYPFHRLKNLALSPYRAGYIRGESPHLIDVVKNLTLFAKENRLINIADIQAGY